MNKTKKTALNAITQIISVFVQSVFLLFVTKIIISNIGSDYNGLTSTASQLLTFLLLLEGGFSLASLVKLYKPFNENNYEELSKYLSLSKKQFKKIGILYFIVGISISIIYAFFVKTSASYFEVVIIFALSVASSSFSVYYVTKYRLIYQVSQSEYIIYIIQTIFYILMYSAEILVAIFAKDILLVRLCVLVFQVFQSFVIGFDARRRFKRIEFNASADGVEIKGTKDVFFSRIGGLVYSSAPVLFISTFVGTIFTSVYAVYNSVISVVSNAINALLIAPRNALGQIVHENDNKRLNSIFNEYEYISSLSLSILCSTTFALIIPFVRIYTKGVDDIDYINVLLAVLLVLNSALQMIHIPSGTCIEIAGHFKAIKIIQLIAAALIIILSTVGALVWGIYGILLAKVITSLYLCVAETVYVRKNILKTNPLFFFKNTLPTVLIAVIISIFEFLLLRNKAVSIIGFIAYGFAIIAINTVVLCFVGIVFNRNSFLSLINRTKNLIFKRWMKR